jgi:hypothetical protein
MFGTYICDGGDARSGAIAEGSLNGPGVHFLPNLAALGRVPSTLLSTSSAARPAWPEGGVCQQRTLLHKLPGNRCPVLLLKTSHECHNYIFYQVNQASLPCHVADTISTTYPNIGASPKHYLPIWQPVASAATWQRASADTLAPWRTGRMRCSTRDAHHSQHVVRSLWTLPRAARPSPQAPESPTHASHS